MVNDTERPTQLCVVCTNLSRKVIMKFRQADDGQQPYDGWASHSYLARLQLWVGVVIYDLRGQQK